MDFSNDDDADLDSVSEDEGVDGVGSEMMELRRKKRELRQQLARQQKQQRAHQVDTQIVTDWKIREILSQAALNVFQINFKSLNS